MATTTTPAAAGVMTAAELAEAVSEYRHYTRIIEEAETILDGIKDALKSHMTATNADTVNGPDYKITWRTVAGTKLDRAGIEAEYPGLIDRYTIPNPSRRFSVK